MNVLKLNEFISGNKDAVESILENLECENIRYSRTHDEYRFSKEYGKNPTASRVKVNNLRYQCFSSGEQGSIYNLIMDKKGFSFPEALRWAAKTLGIDQKKLNTQVQLPFGGFYKSIIKEAQEPELALPTYPTSILQPFGHVSNIAFLNDGIDIETQENFSLGYDLETDRITIPQWDVNGELVGVMGRSNDPQIPYEFRWLPIIPCSRSHTLYGYHKNYAGIQKKQICVIAESEKGVMQLCSMGFPVGLATCTRSISSTQAKYLKALRVDRLILAYDEGIPESDLAAEALKIRMKNPIYTNRVGYIFDKDGDILKKGSKDSPTDLGREAFRTLANKYTKWI